MISPLKRVDERTAFVKKAGLGGTAPIEVNKSTSTPPLYVALPSYWLRVLPFLAREEQRAERFDVSQCQ